LQATGSTTLMARLRAGARPIRTGSILTAAAACTIGAFFAAWPKPAAAGSQDFPAVTARVDRATLLGAMLKERAKGYNLLVSTQAGRFTAAVILDLTAQARAQRPGGPALLLHYDDWFEAYRLCNGLDSAAVPEFVTLQRTHHQSQFVEYDIAGVKAKAGPDPLTVVHVYAGWPDSQGAASEYTFVDTAASPDMEVTNERFISYWLVDYGDVVHRDRIEGVRGRPLQGALALAFKWVGSGRAEWSRTIITGDGLVLTYARAAKGPFAVNLVTTTFANGLLVKGLPEGRTDLEPLEDRLKGEFELSYPEPAAEASAAH
jgi:hypothetical protein